VANLTLSSFRRYVEPFATGVSYFEILFNAQETLRDFCARTKCWQVLLPPFSTVAGQAEYTLVPPTAGIISQVEEIFYQKYPIHFTGLDDLQKYYQQNWMLLSNSRPEWSASFDPGTINFITAPDKAEQVYVRAAIMPDNALNLDAVEFPEFIFSRWATQITDGMLARLYSMPDKPFSNVKRSDAKTLRYEQHVAAVKIKVAKSFGRQELETLPQYY
jgi:hypothetical protein